MPRGERRGERVPGGREGVVVAVVGEHARRVVVVVVVVIVVVFVVVVVVVARLLQDGGGDPLPALDGARTRLPPPRRSLARARETRRRADRARSVWLAHAREQSARVGPPDVHGAGVVRGRRERNASAGSVQERQARHVSSSVCVVRREAGRERVDDVVPVAPVAEPPRPARAPHLDHGGGWRRVAGAARRQPALVRGRRQRGDASREDALFFHHVKIVGGPSSPLRVGRREEPFGAGSRTFAGDGIRRGVIVSRREVRAPRAQRLQAQRPRRVVVVVREKKGVVAIVVSRGIRRANSFGFSSHSVLVRLELARVRRGEPAVRVAPLVAVRGGRTGESPFGIGKNPGPGRNRTRSRMLRGPAVESRREKSLERKEVRHGIPQRAERNLLADHGVDGER